MPFDDTTVVGYNVAFSIQLFGSWVICAIICAVNSFFFGVCWYFEALLFDLKSIFEQINSQLTDKHCTSKSVRCIIRQKLNEFIGFHFSIIALVSIYRNIKKKKKMFEFFSFIIWHFTFCSVIEKFGDLMSGTVFMTFAISVTWLCTSFFQIHAVSE